MGGHRNEPIYESVQDGWDNGTREFLSAIEGEMSLPPYTKKLLTNLPVRMEQSLISEEMFYADTEIPNVHVKYCYSEGQDRPNMVVRVSPFE